MRKTVAAKVARRKAPVWVRLTPEHCHYWCTDRPTPRKATTTAIGADGVVRPACRACAAERRELRKLETNPQFMALVDRVCRAMIKAERAERAQARRAA